MISYLKGKIKLAGEDFIILAVSGVGYRVYTTHKMLGSIRNSKEEIELFIHQHIREDSLDLFGFSSMTELDFFEIITSVSGVGPRIGLAVLEISSVDDLKQAIGTSNVDFLTRVPGIGRKKAELIILELKSKMDVLIDGKLVAISEKDSDAVNALIRLGYKKPEAVLALEGIPDDVKDVGERVKLALKGIGKR
ncbi:MAG: Holliday junction branch migration protein RuvA [Parcubacteria group bacterium]|nr:Holliday junction branch migration protein RuvA [Parcubacteria group bacterium]